jgi:hypothetical protein
MTEQEIDAMKPQADPTPLCPLRGKPCVEQNCAWWANGRCAVLYIAHNLADINTELEIRRAQAVY